MKPKRKKKPKESWPGHAPAATDDPGHKGARALKRAAPPSKRKAPGTKRHAPPEDAQAPKAPTIRRAPVVRGPVARDDRPVPLYVVCAPGLERLTSTELRDRGLSGGEGEPGGVTLEGNAEVIYAANLHLRSASRVIARVAEFTVTTFYELEARARHIEWERWLGAEPVRVRVTCRKSKLYHSDAVAQRFVEAMAKRTGAWASTGALDAEGESEGEDAQLFVIRVLHDRCTVSVDTSGALLHRRGYRQAIAKAPLRETIAASMLLASGWNGETPLIDPLCGAGTIPIEAALLARRIAPGIGRGFAFMRWPSFEKEVWDRLVAGARERELPNAPSPITGTDRDAGAIEAAEANAARAGVSGDVELARRSLSAIEPPGTRGWLITNPPYGVRVGAPDTIRDLYAQLGNVARRTLPGWNIGFLSPDRTLDSQPRIAVTPAFETTNGGIKVRYLTGRVSEGRV